MNLTELNKKTILIVDGNSVISSNLDMCELRGFSIKWKECFSIHYWENITVFEYEDNYIEYKVDISYIKMQEVNGYISKAETNFFITNKRYSEKNWKR